MTLTTDDGLPASVWKPVSSDSAAPLSEAERHRLLVEWNQTEVSFDRDKCIHELIGVQVGRAPERIAVVCRGESLTYRQLNERAAHLAERLRTLGVGAESVVAVCMERSVDLMVALLSVLKAGAAYLPLDSRFPQERIDFMLDNSQAAVLLTQASWADRFEGRATHVVTADTFGDCSVASNVISAVSPSNLAYLMYTSGSTGKPKGVMVEHRNVVNFCAAMDQMLGTEPGVWLAVTSISFDISVLELFWTLTRGYTVILHANEGVELSTDQDSLLGLLNEYSVTHLQCTPTLARMLIRMPGVVSAMKSLGTLLIGGEPLLLPLAQQLRTLFAAQIFNMYGPTETTIWSTAHALNDDDKSIPIGRPIANTQIYILDDQMRLAPPGAVGELYIGGDGVARGYWKRPELNAERFVPDHFRGGNNGRLYKTGDQARYRSDGTIEFIGRNDDQVKIRGFRIELGEIESVLQSHPGVLDAAVSVRESAGNGNPQLIAYVIPAHDSNSIASELKILARLKLPEYMVPSSVVLLERLPTTPNGKVDRKNLPAPQAAATSSASAVASRTELEAKIAGIWQDALGVDSVELHENFFDLGANSISVAEAAVNLAVGLNLPVKLVDLFTYPTVSSLAAYLSGAGESSKSTGQASQRGTARREALSRRRNGTGDRKGAS